MDISNLDYSTALDLKTRSRQSPDCALKGGLNLNSLFFLVGPVDELESPDMQLPVDGLCGLPEPTSPNGRRTYTLGGLNITEISASNGGTTSRSVVGSGVVGGRTITFASASASSS